MYRAELWYVDAITSLKYVAQVAQESSQAHAVALRTEMISTIKGGLGPSFDMSGFHSLLTDSFLKSIPPDLTRKCISFMLHHNLPCSTRGFILDTWAPLPVALIASESDLLGMLTPFKYNGTSKCFEETGEAARRIEILIEILVLITIYYYS